MTREHFLIFIVVSPIVDMNALTDWLTDWFHTSNRLTHQQAQDTRINTLTCLLMNTHTHFVLHSVFITSVPDSEQWNFHCTPLYFYLLSHNSRERSSSTCLSVASLNNKSHLLIKPADRRFTCRQEVAVLTSQPAHTSFHLIQQRLCVSPYKEELWVKAE